MWSSGMDACETRTTDHLVPKAWEVSEAHEYIPFYESSVWSGQPMWHRLGGGADESMVISESCGGND